ncbi:hypothetical protein [Halalkalibacter hemicellulosilyticus]|uniref:Uncharacterized protein n=1 Tax=Halalkalibacter hemicellulosilyticusJCM 9152 TaxID=1236971 RepID=W4QGP7_9BACI|nr:hypothetical protein [Halalkalibacter hemicellulosilyticus]GAE31285.1 hypothetical protein JCM9152_2742 [Halalkalibacter hemicellulosilyticusJCM 9152]
MKKVLWMMVVVTLFLAIGCQQQGAHYDSGDGQGVQNASDEPGTNRVMYGLFGPGPLNYGQIRKQQLGRYDLDEMPNTGTNFRSMDVERRHLGNDQQLIAEIIQEDFGLESGMVFLAGNHAFVNVKAPKDMEEKEKKEYFDELRQQLSREIPRYNVHISETD